MLLTIPREIDFNYFFSVIFNARHTIQQDSSAVLLLFFFFLLYVYQKLFDVWLWGGENGHREQMECVGFLLVVLLLLFDFMHLAMGGFHISKLEWSGRVFSLLVFRCRVSFSAICLRGARLIFVKCLLFRFCAFCAFCVL